MRSATKARVGKDPEYLEWIASQPCLCCEIMKRNMRAAGIEFVIHAQETRTEAAHVGPRGLSQKCPDRETLPLCGWEHHREGKLSVHKLGRKFWDMWSIDREKLIAEYQARFEAERASMSFGDMDGRAV